MKLSEALEQIRGLGENVTMGRIFDALGTRGHALLCIVMTLPFVQPIPLAGLSTVIGIVIMIVGTLLVQEKPPWLPARLRNREIPPRVLERVISTGLAIMRRLERFIKPRGHFLHAHRWARIVAGVVIAGSGFLLALPFPIPASNMLPAIAILATSLGLLEEDGALVVAGYVAFVVATAFIVAIVVLPFLGYQHFKAPPALKTLTSLQMGTAVNATALRDDEDYREALAKHFGLLTPGRAMKMDHVHPRPDAYDFRDADAIVAFAQENGQEVRGHTLVWHEEVPAWMREAPDLRAAMVEHIEKVAGHFAGRVVYWDVVNEAIEKDGSPRASLWTKVDDYVALAFTTARRVDPKAKLFYNDFGTEWHQAKEDGVFALVDSLVKRGVPIDGVGFQLHTETEPFDVERLRRQFARFAALGLELHVTEMDARIKIDDGVSDAELAGQRANYQNALRVCLETPACKVFTTWGFTDRYSWVPSVFKGFGQALPFDEDLRAKPVFWSLVDLLGEVER